MKKALRILAMLWFANSVYYTVAHIAALFVGITAFTPVFYFHFLFWAASAFTTFSLLLLKDWARKVVLVFWAIVVPLYTFAMLSRFDLGLPTSLAGWIGSIVLLALFALLVWLLWVSKEITQSNAPDPKRKAWIYGAFAFLAANAVYTGFQVSGDKGTFESLPLVPQPSILDEPLVISGFHQLPFALNKKENLRDRSFAPMVPASIARHGATLYLRGFPFIENGEVILDLERNALSVDGWVLTGRELTGQTPILDRLPYRGVKFTRDFGGVYGTIHLFIVDDELLLFAYDEFSVYGIVAETTWYAWLEPSGEP